MGLERLRTEFELTQQQLADLVGNLCCHRQQPTLLNLGAPARSALEAGGGDGPRAALLGLSGPQQDEATKRVVSQKLTVRDAEIGAATLVRQGAEAKMPAKVDPDVQVCRED